MKICKSPQLRERYTALFVIAGKNLKEPRPTLRLSGADLKYMQAVLEDQVQYNDIMGTSQLAKWQLLGSEWDYINKVI